MKDIGESFKEARESIGLSKSEVVKDLGITEGQLDNLEDGNANAFKDIFFLKDLVKKYTVYLNLDEDKVMDSFNSFIFSYTSRIPVDEIMEKTKEINLKEKQEGDKIMSPYTIKKAKKDVKRTYLFLILAFIFILFVMVTVTLLKKANDVKTLDGSIVERSMILNL